jgi:hypothetical protein
MDDYTWSIIIVIAFVFLIVLHVLRYYPKKRFLLLYLILSSTIAVDVLKSSLTGAPTGVEADVSVGFSHGFGFSQFSERLKTLAETVQTYYGGAYANIAILPCNVLVGPLQDSRVKQYFYIHLFFKRFDSSNPRRLGSAKPSLV